LATQSTRDSKETAMRFPRPPLSVRSLLAVLSALWVASAGYSGEEPALTSTTATRQQTKVLFGAREVAILHSGAALDKPYIHPLWTPDGRCITYDAPADHIHHRGLCVGWPDVSGTDFWAERYSPPGRRGQILTRSLTADDLPDGSRRVRAANLWVCQDGTRLLEGEQVWTFLPPRGNLQIVDLDLRLEAVAPEVVFGSDPKKPREYHGLTLRIGPFTNPRFFNSEGDEGGQACHGKPARWCAAAGLQSGRPATAAILDHPSNDRHPTRFFALDRGMQFISSSPNFGKPKNLKKGETWRLRYRVVAAGQPPSGDRWDLDALWAEFAKK
jgi:hypothetical protein